MPVNRIFNGRIENISTERGTSFVTVTYRDRQGNRRNEQTIRLVVNPRTLILDRNNTPVPARALRRGMIINATYSSAVTRSIPPQATAYRIKITGEPVSDTVTVGRILEVDGRGRSFTTISDRDISSVIRFNVPENTPIFDRAGRPINFGRLNSGMRVRVRHANFMTASIPPQTTAFEARVL